MKRFSHVWILTVLLVAGGVNSFFFLPNCWNAVVSWTTVHGLSNVELRTLQKGDWYRVVLAIENQIPENASIRLVSNAPPWYLTYYFYPRLLKRGSEVLADRDVVRKQYPEDWVLVYSEAPAYDMKAYPPAGRSHG